MFIPNEVKEIKEYAITNNVPIMQDDGIDFLTSFIMKNNINSVLEIGSAIGYSAIMMALANPNLTVITVERDRNRYLEAVKNINKLNLQDRITIHFKDAFDLVVEDKVDLIFIDAAKAQSIKFFNMFERNLNDGGYIITDNMSFHGLVDKFDYEIESRNVRQLVRKIRKYKEFLLDKKDYKVEFLTLGDGIAIAEKKKKEIEE